jgi:hypothetical protein
MTRVSTESAAARARVYQSGDFVRRLNAAAGRLEKEGRAYEVGTYTLKHYSCPVVKLDLPTLGLEMVMHGTTRGEIEASVKTRQEITLDTKGMRPRQPRTSAVSNHPLDNYDWYGLDHSRFSFDYSGDFQTIFGRLLAATLFCEPKNGLSLAEWVELHTGLIGYQPGYDQVIMWNDLRAACLKTDPGSIFGVIGSHRSVDITLPVISIKLPGLGLHFWSRDNFYDSAVTVSAMRPILGLKTRDMILTRLNSVYFQGFRESGAPVYGPYGQDPYNFSFHCGNDLLPIIARIIKAAVKVVCL